MNSTTIPYFLSTAIPYVNAKPHLGHALEFVQADIIARYQRLQRGAEQVYSLSGSDDNALKNVQAAEAAGLPVGEFVQSNADRFRALHRELGNELTYFISTSLDSRHSPGAQKLWSASKPGDIYKKSYTGHYCIGCEEFKVAKDLVQGECPEHPGKRLEEIEEENYFFRLSNYGEQLEKLIVDGTLKIVPEGKKNETLAFIRGGLEDFSVSRSVARAKGWGVPVPGDAQQVMYVWYDALANYITALDYAGNGADYQRYWSGNSERVHVIGKGINRFHTVYWPAMLLSAGVPLPTTIVIHGYITVDGQKMSKSLGNVIDPLDLVNEFGAEVVRYYFARHLSIFNDGDFRSTALKEAYNASLANGLGNLVSRVMKMATTHVSSPVVTDQITIPTAYHDAFARYDITAAAEVIWQEIGRADEYVNSTQPFKTIKVDRVRALNDLEELVRRVALIATMLQPFMPRTAATILEHVRAHTMPAPLFARRE